MYMTGAKFAPYSAPDTRHIDTPLKYIKHTIIHVLPKRSVDGHTIFDF